MEATLEKTQYEEGAIINECALGTTRRVDNNMNAPSGASAHLNVIAMEEAVTDKSGCAAAHHTVIDGKIDGNMNAPSGTAVYAEVPSFEIQRAVTHKRIFGKIKLTPNAKNVLRTLIDFYNPDKGYVYPGQKTIAECADVCLKSVTNSINELKEKELILTVKYKSRLVYFFSRKFYELIDLTDLKECVKFAQGSSKIYLSGSVKNTHACIEQDKFNKIKRSPVNNNFDFDLKQRADKLKVTKLLEGDNCLTNKVLAEVVLGSMHESNLNDDKQLEIVLYIQEVWNFDSDQYGILAALEAKMSQSTLFEKKITLLRQQVKILFSGA